MHLRQCCCHAMSAVLGDSYTIQTFLNTMVLLAVPSWRQRHGQSRHGLRTTRLRELLSGALPPVLLETLTTLNFNAFSTSESSVARSA